MRQMNELRTQETLAHGHLFQSIADLRPGDHLCSLYETEGEHRTLLTPFLRQGLEGGEKVLYIVDVHTAEAVAGYLREDGVKVDPYQESGQLGILRAEEVYVRDGTFDPDSMIALLRTETERALGEGYSALRVTGEMSWVLRKPHGSDRLIEYEARLNEFFPGSRCLALCQYDRRRFEPAVLLDVLRTHPIVAVGAVLHDNFYYIPPAELFGNDVPMVELRHWVRNLTERKRAEEALSLSYELLRIANKTAEMSPLLEAFVAQVKSFTRCAAVGIRVLDEDDNIPYQVYDGFSREFYELESPLSLESHRCMCINVIKGATDPQRPFFTEGGAFYINATMDFLAAASEGEKIETRNICSEFGYESVALVPMRLGDCILGLIHVADHRQGMLPLEMVEALEAAAVQLGVAIQRVRAEEEVRSLARFPSENPNPVLRVDRQGTVVYANAASEALVQHGRLRPGSPVPAPWQDSIAEALSRRSQTILEVRRKGRVFSFVVAPVAGAGYVNLYGRDITEQRRAERELREHEQQLAALVQERTRELTEANRQLQEEIAEHKRADAALESERRRLFSVLDGLPAAVNLQAPDYSIRFANRHFRDQFGEPGSRPCYQIIYNRNEPCIPCQTFRVFETQTPNEWERLLADGRTYRMYGYPFSDTDGSALVLQLGIDITEHKRAQEEVQAYQRRLRSLASRLSLVEERERREVAAAIHDHIGQALALSKLRLGALRRPLPESALAEALDAVSGLIDESIDYTRSLVFELSPPILYELGLDAALERLAENMERQHEIGTEFEDDGRPKPLKDDVRVLLFRSVRELLMNVVKHARARNVKICIRREDSEVHVSVEDDGVGFRHAQSGLQLQRNGGFGLFSIRERLHHLGGRVELRSQPGQGTAVTLVAPLARQEGNVRGDENGCESSAG